MIGTPTTGRLASAIISGVAHEGLTVRTRDGQPAQLAVVDAEGRVIEFGPAVAAEAMAVALTVYRNFLKGNGHLRVYSEPPRAPWQSAA